jgi:hypothetical protein
MKLVRLIKMCLNEMYSEVYICKHLSINFLIQNDLKQGHPLLPLLFSVALGYEIRKMHENQVGLKLNGRHLVLTYANGMILVRWALSPQHDVSSGHG